MYTIAWDVLSCYMKLQGHVVYFITTCPSNLPCSQGDALMLSFAAVIIVKQVEVVFHTIAAAKISSAFSLTCLPIVIKLHYDLEVKDAYDMLRMISASFHVILKRSSWSYGDLSSYRSMAV